MDNFFTPLFIILDPSWNVYFEEPAGPVRHGRFDAFHLRFGLGPYSVLLNDIYFRGTDYNIHSFLNIICERLNFALT